MVENQPKEGWGDAQDFIILLENTGRFTREGKFERFWQTEDMKEITARISALLHQNEQRVAGAAVSDFVRLFIQPYFAEHVIGLPHFRQVEKLADEFIKFHHNITE